MIEFHFVNHSGFILSKDNTKLAFDPWIDGSVFNNSWNLLAETPQETLNILSKSDYVWFSHEHPDHFNPPNLNIFNSDTKFLFQETKDRRVLNYIKKKISNNIYEVSKNNIFNLEKNFSIEIVPFQYLDSMSIINIEDITILNLNDCDIKNMSEIKEILNKTNKVDILLIQFSYAIGKYNENEKNKREQLSLKILKNLSNIINFINPTITIPFASFCYFSRNDNFYLNDSINKIEDTINYLKNKHPNKEFYCFYPGDKWNLRDKWDNQTSIEKYNLAYSKIKPKNYEAKSILVDDIYKASQKFIYNTISNNNLFNVYKLINYKFYKINFYVTDLKKKYSFDFDNGLNEQQSYSKDDPFCKLSSDSLFQLFNSGYGYDALIIGGRFEANNPGLSNLNKIFKFQAKNYQNIYYNFYDIVLRFFKKIFKPNNAFNLR